MIILGLGSNVGDRLAHLRKAFHAIKNIPSVTISNVSPVYLSDALLPENAPPEWDMPHLNLAIACKTQLEPLALLKQLKTIEYNIGRKPALRHWGPRIIDIDILAWDDLIIDTDALTVPHQNLKERPFALWPLADVAPLWIFPFPGPDQGKTASQIAEKWGSRFTGDAPLRTRQIYHRIDTPQLVGTLNITPDSFSDGGHFLQAEKALQQAVHLVESGAEIIDIGAESTAPRANPIDPQIEWERLQPILTLIHNTRAQFIIPPKISVDTRHVDVASKALLMGVDWINDVTGLDDPGMREIIVQSNADCVVMHHRQIPERREHVLPRDQDPVKIVRAWAEERLNELERQGINRDRIIFDPGIGFGKMAEQSLLLLKNADAFSHLNTRLMIGHSRKTFFSLMSPFPFAERDIETTALSLCLSRQPITYLRIHNVEMCARAFRAMKAIEGEASIQMLTQATDLAVR